jgi:predicted DNA-binding ribbon-helix-helix protein
MRDGSVCLVPGHRDASTQSPTSREIAGSQKKHPSRRATSVTLEDAFWDAIKGIAADQQTEVDRLIATINRERQNTNLSSAIRLYVLGHYRSRCSLDQPRPSGDPC